MLKRTITAIILYGILAPLLLIDALRFFAFIALAILALIGTWEMIKMFDHDQKSSLLAKISTYLANILLSFGIIVSIGTKNLVFFISCLALGLAILVSMLVFDKDSNANKLAHSVLSAFLPAIGFGAIMVIRTLGIRFIIYLFLISSLTDTFAYAYGLLFGKHLLAPNISPKKTWEGSISATIVASLISIFYAIFYGALFFNEDKILFVGIGTFASNNQVLATILVVLGTVLLSVSSQIGDLVFSKMKRTYGIKDFSNVLPGHGGVLDRFDSVIFASLILCALMLLVGLV